jgi:predicted metallo-beta-lactamase superfamily hydrolase
MGTRSLATNITTRDCRILIDPGVALCPIRYRLPPHKSEDVMMKIHWNRIRKFAGKSDVMIVSHYHFDHHDPDRPEIYRDKTLLTKHPKKDINKSQEKRAERFLANLGEGPRTVEFSDGSEFSFGRTSIRFSEAVPHGPDTRLGYVTMINIDDGRTKFLFTSDVEGPCRDEQVSFLLGEDPHVIFCDGPMTYMLGYRYSKRSYETSLANLERIIEETGVKCLVLDHHLLRDIKWEERINRLLKTAKRSGVMLVTGAGFAGREDNALEARRKELFASYGT